MGGLDEHTKGLVMKRVLSRVKEIPSLPDAVVKALKMLNSAKSSANDVADVLSRDEGLAVRILRLANSAYYGMSRQITNLNEAVALLGFKTVKSIVLAASIYGYVNRNLEGYALERGALWKHSIAVAIVGRMLAKHIKYPDPEEVFIAGLLHDLGKIVLNEYVRFGFAIIVRMVEEEQVPFMTAERQVLGFDHAEIGSKIVEQWGLPQGLASVCLCHHEPEKAPSEHARLVDIIHLANAMVLMLGIGVGSDGLLYPLKEEAVAALNLKNSIDDLMSEAVDLLAQEDLMSMGD